MKPTENGDKFPKLFGAHYGDFLTKTQIHRGQEKTQNSRENSTFQQK